MTSVMTACLTAMTAVKKKKKKKSPPTYFKHISQILHNFATFAHQRLVDECISVVRSRQQTLARCLVDGERGTEQREGVSRYSLHLPSTNPAPAPALALPGKQWTLATLLRCSELVKRFT